MEKQRKNKKIVRCCRCSRQLRYMKKVNGGFHCDICVKKLEQEEKAKKTKSCKIVERDQEYQRCLFAHKLGSGSVG